MREYRRSEGELRKASLAYVPWRQLEFREQGRVEIALLVAMGKNGSSWISVGLLAGLADLGTVGG